MKANLINLKHLFENMRGSFQLFASGLVVKGPSRQPSPKQELGISKKNKRYPLSYFKFIPRIFGEGIPVLKNKRKNYDRSPKYYF